MYLLSLQSRLYPTLCLLSWFTAILIFKTILEYPSTSTPVIHSEESSNWRVSFWCSRRSFRFECLLVGLCVAWIQLLLWFPFKL